MIVTVRLVRFSRPIAAAAGRAGRSGSAYHLTAHNVSRAVKGYALANGQGLYAPYLAGMPASSPRFLHDRFANLFGSSRGAGHPEPAPGSGGEDRPVAARIDGPGIHFEFKDVRKHLAEIP